MARKSKLRKWRAEKVDEFENVNSAKDVTSITSVNVWIVIKWTINKMKELF